MPGKQRHEANLGKIMGSSPAWATQRDLKKNTHTHTRVQGLKMDGVETEPRGLNPTQRTTGRRREIVYPSEEHTDWLSNAVVVYYLCVSK